MNYLEKHCYRFTMLRFLLQLSEDIRKAIQEDRLLDFKEEFLDKYGRDVYKRAF